MRCVEIIVAALRSEERMNGGAKGIAEKNTRAMAPFIGSQTDVSGWTTAGGGIQSLWF
jgi:hypothetical protein